VQRHKETTSHYSKPRTDDECLSDIADMLYSYHKMIYDLIYQTSICFRVKHWTRLILNRPKLTLARALVKTGRPFLSVTKRHAPAMQKMEQEIAVREAERENLLRKSLGCRD
jgi:lysophospholipid acyltransferase (LPLAT)-like uncharacterized protein